jgi:hypothetical protein
LRTTTHDSGPEWIATPSPYGSFIHNTLPVLPGAQQVAEKPWIAAVQKDSEAGDPSVDPALNLNLDLNGVTLWRVY